MATHGMLVCSFYIKKRFSRGVEEPLNALRMDLAKPSISLKTPTTLTEVLTKLVTLRLRVLTSLVMEVISVVSRVFVTLLTL